MSHPFAIVDFMSTQQTFTPEGKTASDLGIPWFTVADVIEVLRTLPQDAEVVVELYTGELISLDEILTCQTVRLTGHNELGPLAEQLRIWKTAPERPCRRTAKRHLQVRLG